MLCLHGFTGTPLSVRPLEQHLKRNGCDAHAPLLNGHGGTLRDLAESRWENWFDSALDALCRLRVASRQPVAVVGYSMGALLAVELALMFPNDVSALVLMAMPLELPAWQKIWLRRFRKWLPKRLLRHPLLSWPKFGGPDISSHVTYRGDHSLRALPIGAANSLLDLAERVRPKLGEVHQPTLIVHSRGDRVVPFAASEEIVERLGSVEMETLWLERSRHQLCHDIDRQTIFSTVEDFLARHQPR